MATNQDAQSLEETLNKTDLGHIINENKKLIMGGFALIVAGIVAYSIMNQMKDNQRLDVLDQVYQVEQSVFQPFLDKKLSTLEFKQKLGNLDEQMIGHENLVPLFLKSINIITTGQSADAKNDDSVLEMAYTWADKLPKSSPLKLFMLVRIASLEADLGKTDKAIETLELLLSHKVTILKEKILFNLISLYTISGKTDLAKETFQKLEKENKDSQYLKLAKILVNGL